MQQLSGQDASFLYFETVRNTAQLETR